MCFIVKFGWYVEADNMEEAHVLAKRNLFPEGNRAHVDTFEIRCDRDSDDRADLGPDLGPEDTAEYCGECNDFTIVDGVCHECGGEHSRR